MSVWLEILMGVGLLFTLMLSGTPVFVGFLVMNILLLLLIMGTSGFGMFVNSIFATSTLTALASVPLFVLMGDIMFRSGAIEVLLKSIDRLIGRVRGRQFVLCIVLSAILGALSGAAMAVAGLLGRSLLPTMVERGYDRRLSAGTILAGASLDPIIPPSVLAILIATIAQVSTGKLLIAGVMPGLLLTGMFLLYVHIRLILNPRLAPPLDTESKQEGSVIIAILNMMPAVLVFFVVMGFVMLGIATPTEAAATGVLGAMAVAFGYGKLTLKMLKEAFYTATTVSALLLIVMCCAVMFSQLVTLTGLSQSMARFLIELELSPWLMLIAMLGLPFVLNLLCLDMTALMFILIPLYRPLLPIYGFDEIWFYTLMLIIATVGGITPPFGYTLFALKAASPQMSMKDIIAASWPFTGLILLGLVLMAAFPPLITWLPGIVR